MARMPSGTANVSPCLPCRIADECFGGFFIQHAIYLRKHGVAGGNVDLRQRGTATERVCADTGQAIWQRDGGQFVAVVEGVFADSEHTLRQRNGGQAIAVGESGTTDSEYAVRHCECIARFPFRIADKCFGGFLIQHAVYLGKHRVARGDTESRKRIASVEWVYAEAGEAIRQRDGGQGCAAGEGVIPDFPHGVAVQFSGDGQIHIVAGIIGDARAAVFQECVGVVAAGHPFHFLRHPREGGDRQKGTQEQAEGGLEKFLHMYPLQL